MTTKEVELAIVGAGPAGLAAAVAAAKVGVAVTLIDEQPAAGGQIYRNLAGSDDRQRQILGADYTRGQTLFDAFQEVASQVTHISEATVWNVTQARQVTYSKAGSAHTLTARHVILATGAMERPMPFPGWTLPGVMTAGAGQILLKSAGLVPSSDVVLAGSGPLLYLVAVQYIAAGVRINAIVETTPKRAKWAALRYARPALKSHADLRKGLKWLRQIKRAGIPHYRHASNLRARGNDKLSGLTFQHKGQQRDVDCQLLLVHQGVVPNVQTTMALRLPHVWDARAHCWLPRLGGYGRTNVEGISVVGDGAGIVGAEAATLQGQLAGFDVAGRLGRPTLDGATSAVRAMQRLSPLQALRPFLDRLFAPAAEFLVPSDDTIVCRCESVTAGTIRVCVREGCLGPNQLKAFCRAGMGPCQGRQCALTVRQIIAAERGVAVRDVDAVRIRPPLKPVTLGELASLAESDTPYARLD